MFFHIESLVCAFIVTALGSLIVFVLTPRSDHDDGSDL